MSTRKSDLENRIAGALYGFAIGDSMGATTEFETAESIKRKYGKVTDLIGGGWLHTIPGEVTDDTQMTMCVINAIFSAEDSGYTEVFKNTLKHNFIEWMKGGPKDIGSQCAKGIRRMMESKYFTTMDYESGSQGNGSLMRALPCALVDYRGWNLLQSRMTHNSFVTDKIINEYHDTVQRYLKGDFEEYINRQHMEPTGWAVATYNNALYWLQCTQTASDAILGAVNDGGDADTIAAVTGSLAGLRYGYEAIPEEWVSKLDESVKNIFEKFIKKCLQTV